MSLCKTAGIVCIQNFRKWATNYRVWVIAILMVIFTQSFTKEIGDFAELVQIPVSPWIFPFLYNQRYVKLLFFFPLILLFCDAPFLDDNQPYVIARSGRFAWSLGQIAYVVFGSGVYFLFLILCTILLNFPHMMFTMDWGKVIGTLSSTDAASQIGVKTAISSHIIRYFTPLSAMWFTWLLSWLSGVFLGLVIYVVNTVTKTRVMGVLAASFFLVLDAVVLGFPGWMHFSPVSWSNLDFIDIGGITSYPNITYVFSAYGVLICVLIVLAVWASRRQPIEVLPLV